MKEIRIRVSPAGPLGHAEIELDHLRNRSELLGSPQYFMTCSDISPFKICTLKYEDSFLRTQNFISVSVNKNIKTASLK